MSLCTTLEAPWGFTMDEWLVLSRCNRVATKLFSRDRKSADEWGRHAYAVWQLEGIEPEDLAVKRAPGLAKQLGRAVNLASRRRPRAHLS
jgi:hypothetical protein